MSSSGGKSKRRVKTKERKRGKRKGERKEKVLKGGKEKEF